MLANIDWYIDWSQNTYCFVQWSKCNLSGLNKNKAVIPLKFNFLHLKDLLFVFFSLYS